MSNTLTKKEYIKKVSEIEHVLKEVSGQEICFQYFGKIRTYGAMVQLNGCFDEEELELLVQAMKEIKTLRLTLANPMEDV